MTRGMCMYRIAKKRMEMEVSTNICVSVLCVELEDAKLYIFTALYLQVCMDCTLTKRVELLTTRLF